MKFPKIFWNKSKDEKTFEGTKLDSTRVLINGKLITCIVLSIISAFVDIVFFSGLSKSGYPFFGFAVPAAIILSLMSVGFSMAKFFFAMQITLTKELQNQLLSQGYVWAKSLTWAKVGFNIIHKFLIVVSIITSLSLSVITIGNGVRRMEQNINNMTADAQALIDLKESVSDGRKKKTDSAKENIMSSKTAKDDAKQEVDRYYEKLVKYQQEYDTIPESNTKERQAVITKIVKEIPGTTNRNALYFNKADLQKSIQTTATKNDVIDTSSVYEEAIAYDEQSIKEQINALADKDYKLPDGTPVVFVENGEPINISLAISRLQRAIMDWQSDTGDAGASSKVFTLIATYMKADETAGGMATSEVMMMILIFLFGVIQEFIIAKLTPRPIITRKLLSQFNEYINWEQFDADKFLLKVYNIYRKTNVLSSEEFEHKAEKCVRLMNDDIDTVINRLTQKLTLKEQPKKEYSSKVTDAINKMDKLIKESI